MIVLFITIQTQSHKYGFTEDNWRKTSDYQTMLKENKNGTLPTESYIISLLSYNINRGSGLEIINSITFSRTISGGSTCVAVIFIKSTSYYYCGYESFLNIGYVTIHVYEDVLNIL